jgi:hypothetical protein
VKRACAVFSSVVSSAKQYVSTFSHKQHDFREKKFDHKMCVLNLSTNFFQKITHSKKRNERDLILDMCLSSCKVPVFWSDFSKTWFFSSDFREILKYQFS